MSERDSKGGATGGIKVIRLVRSVLARLNGDPGTSVEVTYTSKPGTRSVAKITRERLTGEMSARMGNFPPQHVEFDSRTVQDGIGYIRFNIFVMSIMDRLRSAIRSEHDAAGGKIDLRGKTGGGGAEGCRRGRPDVMRAGGHAGIG